jgi:hypothetical protein
MLYDIIVFHETGFERNISLYSTSADVTLLAWRQETFWKKHISETALSDNLLTGEQTAKIWKLLMLIAVLVVKTGDITDVTMITAADTLKDTET